MAAIAMAPTNPAIEPSTDLRGDSCGKNRWRPNALPTRYALVIATINGTPVHYDYNEKAWNRDSDDKPLTHVPPDEDKWSYVSHK